MQRPEVYELVHSEDIDEERFFQEPIANHRKRHSYIEETLRYLQTRDGLVITVSLAVFGILSAYFHMPCTLYLYLVCVIFTFPLLAINTLLHPQPASRERATVPGTGRVWKYGLSHRVATRARQLVTCYNGTTYLVSV